MCLILPPEAAAVVSPPVAKRRPVLRIDTRPVEPVDRANGVTSIGSRHRAEYDLSSGHEEEPDAPLVGTDPQLSPQAVFDAALIGTGDRPAPRPVVFRTPGETAFPTSISWNDPDAETAQNDLYIHDIAPMEPDTDKYAAYAHAALGSQLSMSASTDPNWLVIVEKTA